VDEEVAPGACSVVRWMDVEHGNSNEGMELW
jgi:hypothetical protein